MGELISATIDELDELDKMYSSKNKRKNNAVKSRVGDSEEILLCYYEIRTTKVLMLSRQDILFYILTDTKVICPSYYNLSGSIQEVRLNNITKVMVNPPNLLNSGNVLLETKEQGNLWIFIGAQDVNFLNQISEKVLKAISNFKFRQNSPARNSASKIPQNTVTEELERLASLHKSGILSDDEFRRAKEKVLKT